MGPIVEVYALYDLSVSFSPREEENGSIGTWIGVSLYMGKYLQKSFGALFVSMQVQTIQTVLEPLQSFDLLECTFMPVSRHRYCIFEVAIAGFHPALFQQPQSTFGKLVSHVVEKLPAPFRGVCFCSKDVTKLYQPVVVT